MIDPFNRLLREVLEAAADPNLHATTQASPLSIAAHLGNCLAAKQLIGHRAEIDAHHLSEPPLIIAARNRDKEMVQILLDAQADTGVRTRTRDSEAVVQGL